MTENQLQKNIEDSEFWKRVLYMLLFAVIYNVAEFVLLFLVVFQVFARLVTGEPNPQLKRFGKQLSSYFYEIFRFLTFNSEEKPFPFREWPSD